MPRRSLISVLFCAALCAAGARAEEAAETAPVVGDLCAQEPRCAALSADGVQRSERKDYRGAMNAFSEAYAVSPEPRLLINIGRCLYRMGQAAQALTYYRRPEVARIAQSPDVRERLERNIEEAAAAVRAEQAARPAPPPPPPVSLRQERPARPRWRVGVGATELVLGLGLSIGATAALLMDGSCVTLAPGGCMARMEEDGRRVTLLHDTAPLGYALLAGAGALVVSGIVTWAVPARRPRRGP